MSLIQPTEPPLELRVEEHDEIYFRVSWQDGDVFLCNIPQSWGDLIAFMCARRLLERGCNPNQLLSVDLAGADFKLMPPTPIGNLANTPTVNPKPVTSPAHCLYAREVSHA